MGCCCSRPVDEDDEVKAVKTSDLSPKKGSYGTITVENGKDVAETPLKEPLPDDNVIRKKETPKSSPVKERVKRVRSNVNDDVSPLLETPPTGFEGLSPKRSPRGTPSGSLKGTPSGSPRGTPQDSPHGSPMPSPKRSPRRSESPAKETLRIKLSNELSASKESLKKKLSRESSPGKEPLQKKLSSQSTSEGRPKSTEGRPKSSDYGKLVDTTSDANSNAPASPTSPKPSLLDLAKNAVHGGNWEPGMSTDPVHSETKDKNTKQESYIDATSDDENPTNFGASFDQSPICHSGDEEMMSPKIVTTFEYTTEAAAPVGATAAAPVPSPKHSASPKHSLSPKHSATYGSTSSLDKREAKAKEAMKKTGKTMKEAGKKFTKMLKFGGGKDSPKTKKKEKKAEQDKDEAAKAKVTFSSTTRLKAAKKESEGLDPTV